MPGSWTHDGPKATPADTSGPSVPILSSDADRRPIRARSHPVWIRVADSLARAGASPNAISIAGLAAGLLAGLSLASTPLVAPPFPRLLLVAAAALILLRLLCNMLDGMVAQAARRASPVGQLFNEIPDRLSDAATLVGLGYAAGSSPRLGFVAALLAVFVAYIRAAAVVAGAPQDFRGPMAKQQRMFTVILVCLYGALAPHAWQPNLHTHGWSVPIAALLLIIIGCVITALRRLRRAAAALT